jgi:2-polyprenyl-6-methoxyphenol hydroxylase-like FAD-dependent oxidoreductase
MAATEITDVLVIGAGPVGLALASELKRHGARVRLVEKRSEPNEHPNAAIVHVRTLEILSAMGAIDGFLKEGFAFPGIHFHFFEKRAVFINVAGVDSPYPLPRTLGQQFTERILADHFKQLGGTVERAIEAVGVEQDTDHVRVRLKHLADSDREEVATARWVVGCEGSSSITRDSAKIDFPGERYHGKEFLQIDANVRWTYPHGFGYSFMTKDYVLLFFAYNDTGHYRIICARNDENPENKTPPTLEEMQGLVRTIADPTAELCHPVWFNRFRSGHRLAASFREGRCFLAGDAGHVHVPIGGQGMNYGIHDAFNLGWKLAAVAKGEARPELLDTYMTERHAVDEDLIKATDFAFHVVVQPNAAARFALHHVAPSVLGLEAAQTRIRNMLGEMNVAYPTSALSEDHDINNGPAAGDRAPDALLVRMPERRTSSVFDVLRGTKWTLLLFAGTTPTADHIEALEKISAPLASRYGARMAIHLILCNDPPVPVHANWAADVLMDRERYVHDKYGVETTPCLYLVRPDWHVGFRGGLDHVKPLHAYLERVFLHHAEG